ncbi:MAG: ABC transporter substrate-binding protein [Actinomycetota bacterium]
MSSGLFLLTGCTAARVTLPSHGARPDVVTIASFNFPESEILAYLYGLVIQARGFRVDVRPDVGTRELVEPALARGLVNFVPEYQGSALAFLTLGRESASADVDATHQALMRALAGREVLALSPSPAQNGNAIVVTSLTATRYRLRTISDLGRVAPFLLFGGPPECPQRPFCLLGLQQRYGLTFRQFIPLDSGGPLTLQALESREIDVALLFSTDPNIATGDLVELKDDRSLQPAENVTPFVREEVLARGGVSLRRAIEDVSSRLTTDVLRRLNALVPQQPPRAVADAWLHGQGLLGANDG